MLARYQPRCVIFFKIEIFIFIVADINRRKFERDSLVLEDHSTIAKDEHDGEGAHLFLRKIDKFLLVVDKRNQAQWIFCSKSF